MRPMRKCRRDVDVDADVRGGVVECDDAVRLQKKCKQCSGGGSSGNAHSTRNAGLGACGGVPRRSSAGRSAAESGAHTAAHTGRRPCYGDSGRSCAHRPPQGIGRPISPEGIRCPTSALRRASQGKLRAPSRPLAGGCASVFPGRTQYAREPDAGSTSKHPGNQRAAAPAGPPPPA